MAFVGFFFAGRFAAFLAGLRLLRLEPARRDADFFFAFFFFVAFFGRAAFFLAAFFLTVFFKAFFFAGGFGRFVERAR